MSYTHSNSLKNALVDEPHSFWLIVLHDRLLARKCHLSVCLCVCLRRFVLCIQTANVSKQVNMKCPSMNTSLQLSSPTPTVSLKLPTIKISEFPCLLPDKVYSYSARKNAYVTWRILCLCDAYAYDVILCYFVPIVNFQRSTIGYLSNSWASCL